MTDYKDTTTPLPQRGFRLAPLILLISLGICLVAVTITAALFSTPKVSIAVPQSLDTLDALMRDETPTPDIAQQAVSRAITIDGFQIPLYPGSLARGDGLTFNVRQLPPREVANWFQLALADAFILDTVQGQQDHLVINGIAADRPASGIVVDLTPQEGGGTRYDIRTITQTLTDAQTITAPPIETGLALGASVEPPEIYLGTLSAITYTVVYSGVGNIHLATTLPDGVMLDIVRLPKQMTYNEQTRILRWDDYLEGPKMIHFHATISKFLITSEGDAPRDLSTHIVAYPQAEDREPIIAPAIVRLRRYRFRQ